MHIVEDAKRADITILRVVGKLDANTALEFEAYVFERLNAGTNNLVLNFELLDYLSSAGLRVLLQIHKHLQKFGGAIALCCLLLNVSDVMEISGFSSIFSIFESEEKAVADIEKKIGW